MSKSKHIIWFAVVTIILVFIDQFTKAAAVNYLTDNTIVVIKDFFKLELLWNRGAAFGILQNSRIFFCVLTITFCLIIEFFYFRIPNIKRYIFLRVDLIVLMAGAIGNLIDRLKRGSVIDYLAFNFGSYHFPSFNVADIYVSVSAICFLILIILYYKDEELSAVFSVKRNKLSKD